jgi:quercetin dioxygenase-like cupin family protein
MHRPTLFVALLIGLPGAAFAQASASPGVTAPAALKRTVLQTHTMVTQPTREAITAIAELSVGGTAPRHLHTGEEIGYVISGTGMVEMEGAAPRVLKAGDSFFVPPNTPHLVRNTGKITWKAVSTYLIEIGKPLAVPAPKP